MEIILVEVVSIESLPKLFFYSKCQSSWNEIKAYLNRTFWRLRETLQLLLMYCWNPVTGKVVKDSEYFQDDGIIWPEGYTAVRKFISIRGAFCILCMPLFFSISFDHPILIGTM